MGAHVGCGRHPSPTRQAPCRGRLGGSGRGLSLRRWRCPRVCPPQAVDRAAGGKLRGGLPEPRDPPTGQLHGPLLPSHQATLPSAHDPLGPVWASSLFMTKLYHQGHSHSAWPPATLCPEPRHLHASTPQALPHSKQSSAHRRVPPSVLHVLPLRDLKGRAESRAQSLPSRTPASLPSPRPSRLQTRTRPGPGSRPLACKPHGLGPGCSALPRTWSSPRGIGTNGHGAASGTSGRHARTGFHTSSWGWKGYHSFNFVTTSVCVQPFGENCACSDSMGPASWGDTDGWCGDVSDPHVYRKK